MAPCSFVSMYHRFPGKFPWFTHRTEDCFNARRMQQFTPKHCYQSKKSTWRHFAQDSNKHMFVILVKGFSQQLNLMGNSTPFLDVKFRNTFLIQRVGSDPSYYRLHISSSSHSLSSTPPTAGLVQEELIFCSSQFLDSDKTFQNLCVIWSVVHPAESRSKNKKSLDAIKIGVTSPRYYLGNRSTCFRPRKYFCCLDQFLKFWWIWFQTTPAAI